MEMLKSVSQAFKVREIRAKMIFTILMLAVFRLGCCIPVPGLSATALQAMQNQSTEGIMGMANLFSGGAFSNMTLFALSVTPYITASIIIQLLTVAFPYFENLAKEGMEGRKKMTAITRYMTVGLALVQAFGMTFGLFRSSLIESSALNYVVITLVLAAGTTFLMWLGEQINEYGIGNGISLIIFGGIIARIPADISSILNKVKSGEANFISVILFAAFAILVVVGIIMVQQGTRKIPVQYAKRVVGRKMYGGQSTHIPLKVNQAGVIPIIFALALLQFPATIAQMFPNSGFAEFYSKWLSMGGNPGVWVYSICNILLILFFNYFYTAITFNPVEVADNMKQNGGFIPGIRPGQPTVAYLSNIMSKISIVGAIFLAAVATLPTIVAKFTAFDDIRFGGTSLLIAVGVALDTMQQLQNQMLMRNYQGFLK